MLRWRSSITTVVALMLGLGQATAQGPTHEFRVIVHPDVAVDHVTRRFVSDAFLKKVIEWPGGVPIRPVDLTDRSPMRARFARDMLNRSLHAVKSYWQQMIFSGRRLPPPEMESEEHVVRYVLRHPGAIGYVSVDAQIGGARMVRVEP